MGSAMHTLRIAVAILLLCAFAAGFTALMITSEPAAAEQLPSPAPAARPAAAPVEPPPAVTVDNADEREKPEPARQPDSMDGKCASCPPVRKPKPQKPGRRQKAEPAVDSVADSCADC
jgi:hypothetical protein